MKSIVILSAAALFAVTACTSDDVSSDGKCWGAIRDYAPDGTLVSDVRHQRDCADCGRYVYWKCPGGEGACGEYYDALGIFNCD